MAKTSSVQKFVSVSQLLVAGLAILLSSLGVASGTAKSSNAATTGRIRQGLVIQKSQHNFVSLKDFNSQLKVKVKEYQVASFTSMENSTQSMHYKADGSKSSIAGNVRVTYAQSMINFEDGTKKSTQSILGRLSGAISENYTLMGQITGNKDLQYTESEKRNGVSDLPIILSQKHVDLFSWLQGGFGLTTVVPFSRYSTVYQNYQGSLGASYTFALHPDVLANGLKISTSIGVSRNFHKFETDKAGTILNPYGMKESVAASYELGSFGFSFELIHRHAWNYEETVSESFEHTEEVSFAVTKQWGISLGHTNSGSWLAPNGQDSNLKLVNDNDSIIYGSMSLTF